MPSCLFVEIRKSYHVTDNLDLNYSYENSMKSKALAIKFAAKMLFYSIRMQVVKAKSTVADDWVTQAISAITAVV